MAAVLPTSVKRTDKGRFCRAKAFIRNKNAANRLIASWSALKKQENEKSVRDLEVCSGFPLRGRRVVELNVLAEALDGGCEACGATLRLSNCIKEAVSGLGSLLYICCSNSECGETNICRTNKTHVNTKLAAGMLHAGIGPTLVNELLSSINVPSLGDSTLKAREREVGPQIEKLAKESCLESLESGRNLWKEDNEKENVAIGASFDMGWQKRGKAHNSLTGVGSMVGLKTGKVICYVSRSKRCATCETASRQSKKPRIHDCRLNWEGSSKAMEADVCVDLVKRCSLNALAFYVTKCYFCGFTLLNSCGDVYASNAKKLAPLGSSQANEALNNTIGSKAPKIRHYGSCKSNNFWVACAVGQKNLGHSYVSQAFMKTQLSPGSNSLKFAKKMDKRILNLKEKQKTREYKKKRIEKKEKQLKKTKQLENREGQQYSSGMGFDGHNATQEIPAPPAASKMEKVLLSKDHHQIIFDLETSGRGN
ncbi:uncharacterized protein [Pocillopora verrucosa]|uniref:uncharacterized protein n=1 Tax=Pocillopora verrucosa TaxID=203993 RepID=UPI003340EB4C